LKYAMDKPGTFFFLERKFLNEFKILLLDCFEIVVDLLTRFK
jgi:hypothetical protein